MKSKILFKEFLIWTFWAKMWVQVGSKMAKMLFSYKQPPYYQPSFS